MLFRVATCLYFPQGGQHQHPKQPAVQDGAIRQQPGEPGGGADAGLPGGEAESRKPPLPNPPTVRKGKKTKPPINWSSADWTIHRRLAVTLCQRR